MNPSDAGSTEAARKGGLFALGAPLWLVDSITEAVHSGAGCVLVSGSHGGSSAGQYALQARPLLAVFNDAGVGKDAAGIAALAQLQGAGIAACTVAHDSARIGDAESTLEDGIVSHTNAAAAALGLNAGQRLQQALRISAASTESSPARR